MSTKTEGHLKWLHKIMRVQNESIKEIYGQASALVESNASIAKEIRAIHKTLREAKGANHE